MGRKVSSNSKKNRVRREEYRKEQLSEKLALFEEFQETFLPQLKELLKAGADSERMRTEMAPILTAKALSLAITEKDAGKALALIKDQLDRTEGKAKERSEHTHKFENTPDEQLDAILNSKLAARAADDEDTLQ